MNFVYFLFFVAGVIAFFALLAADIQYRANKDRFTLKVEDAALREFRSCSILAVSVVSFITAYMLTMLKNGWFFEARFLGESTFKFMARSDFFFSLSNFLFGLVSVLAAVLTVYAIHAVVSLVMMSVFSPSGYYGDDSESLLHKVIDSNSKSERFWYLFQYRGIRTSLSYGISCVLVITIIAAIYSYQSFGRYKFYQTTIETPISILSILDSKCESNAVVYSNDRVSCGNTVLTVGDTDFFNGDNGKAIIVVWNEDLSSQKVVFRADSEFAPPTESVAEMTNQLQGHFDLANLTLAKTYISDSSTFQRIAEWESLQL